MKIIDINWPSEEVLEAKIIVTDGIYDLICFAYPFKLKIGDEIDIPLFAFEATHIQRIVNKEYTVEKQFLNSYYFQGLLISKEKGLIKVGGFTIQIDDYIPADIKDLEFISFICDRLDFKVF